LDSLALDDSMSSKYMVTKSSVCIMASRKGPKALPWKDLGVDYAIESTGLVVEADEAKGHIEVGVNKLIILALGRVF
jgi:glyceraldehyde 3-phosphate dehydrogenase